MSSLYHFTVRAFEINNLYLVKEDGESIHLVQKPVAEAPSAQNQPHQQ